MDEYDHVLNKMLMNSIYSLNLMIMIRSNIVDAYDLFFEYSFEVNATPIPLSANGLASLAGVTQSGTISPL
ncbi:MAG: hypothetical protein EZS28_041398 [Streblomastix strix]|uniref:Uncharacterized protein n=1 Tax=Streblomastix strix TaxID=222440 RepID=A0A5J4U067_9EUKA|nr:MAG: hypothetical protein EZS28_041398 [Streblomastix strix]